MGGYLYPGVNANGDVDWLPSWQIAPPPPPPPPDPGALITGYNTTGSARLKDFGWYGRVPYGRTYLGTNRPDPASLFTSGGLVYKAMGLDQPKLVSSDLRANLCISWVNGQLPLTTTSGDAPYLKDVIQAAAASPNVKELIITPRHEYNINVTASQSLADLMTCCVVVSELCHTYGAGKVLCGINPNYNNDAFTIAQIPAAGDCAPGAGFLMDIYDNPSANLGLTGVPSGQTYRAYGTGYHTITNTARTGQFDKLYDQIGNAGYLATGYWWGLGEFQSPRRIAPKPASFYTPNSASPSSWGPLSPYDHSGQKQADQLDAMLTFCATQEVPAHVAILWIQKAAWNHFLDSAGDVEHDDITGSTKGPQFQGWPVTVDPSLPRAVVKKWIDASPAAA